MRPTTQCRRLVTKPLALSLALSLLSIACSTSSGDDAPAARPDGGTITPSTSP